MPGRVASPDTLLAAAYGCRWTSELALPWFETLDTRAETRTADAPVADILVRSQTGPAPHRALARLGVHLWQAEDGLRYTAEDGSIFDTFAGTRVLVSGLREGEPLPLAFYGTVTGTLLAWRGLIPIHGSAVEWNGHGLLFCGPAGAGKSTVAAALLSRGAHLLSDDLSVLHPTQPGAPLQLLAGRTSVRLYPAMAEALAAHVPFSSAPQPAGPKLAVTPPRAGPWTPVPLRALVLLGEPDPHRSPADALCAQLYRPQVMRALPGHRLRLSRLSFAAPHLTMIPFQPGPLRTRVDFEWVAHRVVQALSDAGL